MELTEEIMEKIYSYRELLKSGTITNKIERLEEPKEFDIESTFHNVNMLELELLLKSTSYENYITIEKTLQDLVPNEYLLKIGIGDNIEAKVIPSTLILPFIKESQRVYIETIKKNDYVSGMYIDVQKNKFGILTYISFEQNKKISASYITKSKFRYYYNKSILDFDKKYDTIITKDEFDINSIISEESKLLFIKKSNKLKKFLEKNDKISDLNFILNKYLFKITDTKYINMILDIMVDLSKQSRKVIT